MNTPDSQTLPPLQSQDIKVNTPFNQPNITNPVPQTKQKSNVLRNLLLGAVIFLLLVGGIIFTLARINNNTKIVDKTNGFQFMNLKGWEKISPRQGAYLSLATVNTVNSQQFVISYADVRVVPNPFPKDQMIRVLSEDMTSDITKICQNNASAQKINFQGIQKINIPGTNSYKCIFEAVGVNTNGNILVMETTFVNKPINNLLITTSYQKNLPEEKVKVDRLMSGFQIIN